MALSRSNKNYLFDPIRKQLVKKTPEEIVRQRLITYLCEECGFPPILISVEKSLKEMPHLEQTHIVGDRRADIVCFARDIHPLHSLYPLLLVECKAGSLSMQAVEQAFGYNAWLQAAFIVMANATELRLYSPSLDGGYTTFLPHLLPYQALVARAQVVYAYH
jgi:hypothetical protein